MEAALERASPLIGSAELDSRRAIREEIEVLLNKWIDSLLPSEEQTSITRPRGKVMTIGTGTLELLTPESDIDLVCLLPALPGQSHRAVDENGEVRSPLRNRWIEEFGALLQQNEHVEDYSKIDTAANPTLCCKYRGVDLDILLSILPRKTTIEPEFLEVNATHDNWQTFQDDTVLAELDDASQRSLNGVRVARLLLSDRSLVPDVAVFKLVLRFVKAWAKARGVYNNISGYFGGITWALCVAKVFMKHREERSAEELVCQFFKYFTEIDYDKETVELRTPIAPNTDEATKKLIAMESAWTTKGDASVAVVTPCFPPMNSCHNVNEQNLWVMQEQFFRAATLCQRVKEDPAVWSEFFTPLPFFDSYNIFLRVLVDGTGKNREDFCRLKGSIEAKLRNLVIQLAEREQRARFHLHPHDMGAPESNESQWYIGFDFDPGGDYTSTEEHEHVDLRSACAHWATSVAYETKTSNGVKLHLQIVNANDVAHMRRNSTGVGLKSGFMKTSSKTALIFPHDQKVGGSYQYGNSSSSSSSAGGVDNLNANSSGSSSTGGVVLNSFQHNGAGSGQSLYANLSSSPPTHSVIPGGGGGSSGNGAITGGSSSTSGGGTTTIQPSNIIAGTSATGGPQSGQHNTTAHTTGGVLAGGTGTSSRLLSTGGTTTTITAHGVSSASNYPGTSNGSTPYHQLNPPSSSGINAGTSGAGAGGTTMSKAGSPAALAGGGLTMNMNISTNSTTGGNTNSNSMNNGGGGGAVSLKPNPARGGAGITLTSAAKRVSEDGIDMPNAGGAIKRAKA